MEKTVSDLLHLPHIVIITNSNKDIKTKGFEKGEDAHIFAYKQVNNGIKSITVCAVIHTLEPHGN